MTQLKYDLAKFLVENKKQLSDDLQSEVDSVLQTRDWYANQGLLLSFDVAFADFIEYKLRWALVDHTGNSFDNVSELVDKLFLLEVLGNDLFESERWEKT